MNPSREIDRAKMTPSHHLDAEDLFDYSTGAGEEWLSLFVACHLTYCPECRAEVQLMEDVGGALLEGAPVEAAELPAFDAIAGRLDLRPRDAFAHAGETKGDDAKKVAEAAIRAGEFPFTSRVDPRLRTLPRALRAYLTAERFRWFAPGVRHIPLSLTAEALPLRLIEFKPGFEVPEHRHQANEYVLVLDGVITDTATREIFRTGDLSIRREGDVHGQRIPKTEPCICLVGSTEQVVPTSAWGRFLQRLTGV